MTRIKNTADSPRGVYTLSGLKMFDSGEEDDVELAPGERSSLGSYFQVVKAEAKAKQPSSEETLLGSDLIAGEVEIGGVMHTLGDIVARSFEESGLSVEEWNALDGADREARLSATLDEMTADAAPDAPVDIPADWQAMKWPQRKSLASKLTEEPINNGETADRVIAAEVAKREG